MNQQQFHIDPAKIQDAAVIIQYVKKVADETDNLTFDSSEFNKTIEEEKQIIADHNSAKNQLFIVAKSEDQIIGLLNVRASKKKRLEHVGEFGISVLKAHWNKGVGSSLIKHMIDWSKQSGVIRKLNLKVSVDNHAAIRLYEKYGFEVEGTVRRDVKIGGEFQDTYLMGLLIG